MHFNNVVIVQSLCQILRSAEFSTSNPVYKYWQQVCVEFLNLISLIKVVD
jgi:hypothetical protein